MPDPGNVEYAPSMNARVCFIGGASAAGKSAVAEEVAADHGLVLFRLDSFFLMAEKTGLSGEALNDAARAMSLRFLTERIEAGSRCVVEGTWITPVEAAGLMADAAFHSVFCGYPDADPKARLKEIWASYPERGAHWLMGRSTDEALAFLRAQIEDSRRFRDACKENWGSSSATFPSLRMVRPNSEPTSGW